MFTMLKRVGVFRSALIACGVGVCGGRGGGGAKVREAVGPGWVFRASRLKRKGEVSPRRSYLSSSSSCSRPADSEEKEEEEKEENREGGSIARVTREIRACIPTDTCILTYLRTRIYIYMSAARLCIEVSDVAL